MIINMFSDDSISAQSRIIYVLVLYCLLDRVKGREFDIHRARFTIHLIAAVPTPYSYVVITGHLPL